MKDKFTIALYAISFFLATWGVDTYFNATEPDQIQTACWMWGAAAVLSLTTLIGNKISNKKHGNSL